MGAKILCATSYPTHKIRGWCGQRFFLGIRFGAKQASNRGIGLLGFGVLALYTTSHLNCSLTRGKMWHNRFICNLHKIVSTSKSMALLLSSASCCSVSCWVSTSKWYCFFLLYPAVLNPTGGSGAAEGSGLNRRPKFYDHKFRRRGSSRSTASVASPFAKLLQRYLGLVASVAVKRFATAT